MRLASVFGINLFQNYGEQENTLINNMCKNAIINKKLIIKNKNVIRNFVPIQIFLKSINKIIQTNKNYLIINLGYKSYSLLQIFKLILKYFKKITKKNLKIKYFIKNNLIKSKFKYLNILISNKFKKKIFENEIKNTLKIYYKNY